MLKIKDGLPVTLNLPVSLRDLPYIVSYENFFLIFDFYAFLNAKP